MVKPLGIFSLVFAMRPIMRLWNGNIVLEFLLVMLLVRRWYIWPHMLISLWVKRSYRKMVLGLDNVVKFVTRYKVVNHDIGQCPHLHIEKDGVHWLLLKKATKELRHWLKRVQSVIILYVDWLRWWMNF